MLNEVVVNSAPSMFITKTADKDIVKPGELINYTIELGNTGNEVARNTTLFDLLPENTRFVSASPVATVNGREITWTVGDVAPGDKPTVQLTVEVATPLANQTVIQNYAAVGGDNIDPKVASHQAIVESARLVADMAKMMFLSGALLIINATPRLTVTPLMSPSTAL